VRTFIIAEAGVNHNGSVETAKKLIDAAVEARADAVKFQTFKASSLVIAKAGMARYQSENIGVDEPQIEMLKRLELDKDAYNELAKYCKSKNIIFMSTPFDEVSADLLDAIGVSIFKIPSGEITNKQLIQYIAAKTKPIILSTGMSYLEEVEKAIRWIHEVWGCQIKKPQLTLLHCVSNYPAAASDSNLLAMKTMKTTFGVPVGYSDHTLGIEVAIAAVVTGATVIEKHFTLNKNMKGPDHKASLDPTELNAMIKAIRNVEVSFGNGIKQPVHNEYDIRTVARKSLVSVRDIKVGEILSSSDIKIKRPGNGILPEFKDEVIGLEVRKNISADSTITWEDIRHA